ncbi:MAG: DNA-directed RNA polymerase subunit beta', partial [Calditrichaeota bacterium]|nr:DNA-directed RNA polymerase subunit beta' [Calditrichota bacterium]
MKVFNSHNRYSKIGIALASPQSILARAHGEVLKPETINYRSFKPEKDGLFCERIFGPVKDWECHCGKYKRIRYKGIICDRCGVEVTLKSVRRERMGHISLAVPVVHIWFFRSLPSTIGYLLGIAPKKLEKIIYYEQYVVVDPGHTEYSYGELITEDEYYDILDELGQDEEENRESESGFKALIGGVAIREMLRQLNVETLAVELRDRVKNETAVIKKQDALKRLKIVDAFRTLDEVGEFKNKPEFMVLDVVPVIPPELRPLVPLEGGRFATSDLNDLYRRVIIRNNRLKKLLEIKAPEVILRNEKRMLQEAVDSLFDNSRRAAAVRSDGNRPLKSLSDMLKGKTGRFRQNLLGKRVDYSGRSVIVVGPTMRIYECGLPKMMAIELFKPFVIRKLVERGLVKTVKSAKKMVDKKEQVVWDILEDIIEDHPVLLNRAPTLHRLGIQAFQPKLVEGGAIRLHPLVCAAFNADFDGDQMAVHVPLTYESQLEAKLLMLSAHNLMLPASGRPIAIPSQDIVLGCYFMTKRRDGEIGEGSLFNSFEEVDLALSLRKLSVHAKIKFKYDGKWYDTTAGRVLFNEIVPEEVRYVNELLSKKKIEELVLKVYTHTDNVRTAQFLDDIKDFGFKYATKSAASIALSDIIIPEEKYALVDGAQKEVDTVISEYEMGIITDGERYNKVIDIWTNTSNKVADVMFNKIQNDRQGFNPLYMMSDSGARGSKDQIRQLAGMRGLMAKPQKSLTGSTGEIIENPIKSNFLEGLSVLEYFISTHGARKGLADTALKTADAGYLTRRLVDVAQDVIIYEVDCNTIMGQTIGDLKEGEEIIEPLSERVLGRVTVEDVIDPITNTKMVGTGEMITAKIAEEINKSSVEFIRIRSVLTCESKQGVCAKCYGQNLATGKLVKIGEAVGVIAAQSIGEPGTQLTLRTFHIGGAASLIAATNELTAKYDGKIELENTITVVSSEGKNVVVSRNGKLYIKDDNNRAIMTANIQYGTIMNVADGDDVKKDQLLMQWDPYASVILADFGGKIEFSDITEGITVKTEIDDATGLKLITVIDSKNKNLSPKIIIKDKKTGDVKKEYLIPAGANILVAQGSEIKPAEIMAKIPRSGGKSKDITGGLPRVAELFEARKPKDVAVVTEIDGEVEFGSIKRGVREVFVKGEFETRRYMVPHGKHILVQEGDYVIAGEKITDGSISPQDILAIKGPGAVQEYLVNEIQEV